jgi:hypothetical protein
LSLYDLTQPESITLFQGRADDKGVAQALGPTRGAVVPFFGVHRRAAAVLSDSAR